MTEPLIPADYSDLNSPQLDATRLNTWAGRTNTNSAFRLAAGTPGGPALLGPDGTLAEQYRWEGSSGGVDTLDVFVNYMDKPDGPAPAVADTGQAFTDTRIGAGSALATIVSGRCVEAATGTAAAANYRTIQLSDHSPIKYLTGEWEETAGSTAGQVATLLMWESAWTAGLISVVSNRSTCHAVGTTTGYLVQTADTASPSVVTTYYSVVYPTAPSTNVVTMKIALDEAAQTLTITGYDNVPRVHGPQAAFTAFPCSYAQHEIYLTNPSTDGQVLFRNFGADKVVGTAPTTDTGGSDSTQYLPAPTGVEATDTAAMLAAIDALPAFGGRIAAQSGAYAMSADLPFSKLIKFVGTGGSTADPSVGGTVFYWNSATAQGIDFMVDGCRVEGVYLLNTFSGVQTSGFGLRMAKGVQASFDDSSVFGFYDLVHVDDGTYQTMFGLNLMSPYHDAIVLNNATSGDAGDTLMQTLFIDTRGALRDPTGACIRWQTGSGPRITNIKINAVGAYKFPIGIDCSTANIVDTADLFVDGVSIENVSSIGIKMVRASGTKIVISNQLHGIEFQNVPIGIQLGAGFEDTQIDDIVHYGGTKTIDVLAGAGRFDIGENIRATGVTGPVVAIAAGLETSNFTSTVKLPKRSDDGVLITDGTPGSAAMPVIKYDHERFIDGSLVSATPLPIWTLGMPIYCGGEIETWFNGSHSGVGGFTIYKRISYRVDGAGVITYTEYDTLDDPAATPKPLTTIDVATAGTLIVKLSTSDGAVISVAKGHIKINGSPTQFKVGA